jgi:hypothetical protein
MAMFVEVIVMMRGGWMIGGAFDPGAMEASDSLCADAALDVILWFPNPTEQWLAVGI